MGAPDPQAAGEVVAPHRRTEDAGDLGGDHAALAEHRDEEGQDPDQVRSVAEQALALGQRLVDEADLALLEVPEAAVDQLRGLRGRSRREVVPLDERSLHPS